MTMNATQIRRGIVIVFEGDPCRVVEFRHHTPGNLRAMVQTKLSNLRTGSSFEHRFRAADTVERASWNARARVSLHATARTYHFMNTENYEQLEIDEESLGDTAQWLHAGHEDPGRVLRGPPDRHRAADSLELEVVETEPVIRAATEDGRRQARPSSKTASPSSSALRQPGRPHPRRPPRVEVHRAGEVKGRARAGGEAKA